MLVVKKNRRIGIGIAFEIGRNMLKLWNMLDMMSSSHLHVQQRAESLGGVKRWQGEGRGRA